jgi:hypothetical protein
LKGIDVEEFDIEEFMLEEFEAMRLDLPYVIGLSVWQQGYVWQQIKKDKHVGISKGVGECASHC